jgi:hypothetical protein
VANDLEIVGVPEKHNSRFSKSSVSAASILAGDVLFFKYRSDKFGESEHLAMAVGNKKSPNGVYSYKRKDQVAKNYLSAVKLNKVWHQTASIIIEAYRDEKLKYTSAEDDSSDPQKFQDEGSEEGATATEDIKKAQESRDEKTKQSFMTLVGRSNYRTYIINNVWNANKFGYKEEEAK